MKNSDGRGKAEAQLERLKKELARSEDARARAERERARLAEEGERARREAQSQGEQSQRQLSVLLREREEAQRGGQADRERLTRQVAELQREVGNLQEWKRMTADYLSLKTERGRLAAQLVDEQQTAGAAKKKLLHATQRAESGEERARRAEEAGDAARREAAGLRAEVGEREGETRRAVEQMEKYVLVLEELSKKVKTFEQEKAAAFRERDNALLEMRTVRERYKSLIVGGGAGAGEGAGAGDSYNII